MWSMLLTQPPSLSAAASQSALGNSLIAMHLHCILAELSGPAEAYMSIS